MAEGVWKKKHIHAYVTDFITDGRVLGHTIRSPDGSPGAGSYNAIVNPPGGPPWGLNVARNVTEADAEAAVEEYWADKTPPGWG